jgi:imidazolonepropionase-like amidohydrolase
VIATLAPPDSYQIDANAELLAEERFSHLLTDEIKEHLRQGPPGGIGSLPAANRREVFESQIAVVRSLQEARARIVIGTDASRFMPVAFGVSLHRELELLHRVGLSPVQTLAAATANAADAFRLQDRGRIVPGRRADMLLVRGDPTSDVLATRNILRVWKGGIEIESTRGVTKRP